jgi:DNA-binding MarR family transcriptional regulator
MNEVNVNPGTAKISATPEGATIFSLIEAADTLKENVSAALKKVGLSYPKYDVLSQLLEADDSLSLRILAECQGCAASNITQIVDRLEDEGLVRRVDDPDDRRSVRAELTEEGRRLAQEGATQMELVRAQFAASFSAAERQELARLLGKLI